MAQTDSTAQARPWLWWGMAIAAILLGFADLTLVFLVTGLALLPFFVARRARDRRRLREMLAADAAAERAARESILAELLGPDAATPTAVDTSENGAPEATSEPPRESSTRRDEQP